MNTQNNPPRSVLITGCSSGIGRCVAEGLKARGYRVFASARKVEDVEALREAGFDDALQLDVRDSDSIQTAVRTVLDACDGRLYALFNNGAYGQPGAVEDLTRAVLREQFETNLFGWHELTCAVLPAMRAAGEGRIIQDSSVLGFIGLPLRGAYNSSKYALEGLSDTLRVELHGSGIHVSLIQPGPILSRFRANAMRKFHDNIDVAKSPFRATYEGMLARLNKVGPAAPGTLPPEAVLAKVIDALESANPKPRYPVTWPTWMFVVLKRVLTTRALDRFVRKISKDENQ
ncbi:MAG: SDR family NAD(P)-dependent oxidoreductase [Gammaproteobacteria bacterium]|nr:SDR family NAD(P)-dependent oxidoreductase [Gammaproteobacteria bacterium]MCP5137461.1 SDR family NAD(P)-dependent oxidoreductase [Gammaproteobacteria bacterium]